MPYNHSTVGAHWISPEGRSLTQEPYSGPPVVIEQEHIEPWTWEQSHDPNQVLYNHTLIPAYEEWTLLRVMANSLRFCLIFLFLFPISLGLYHGNPWHGLALGTFFFTLLWVPLTGVFYTAPVVNRWYLSEWPRKMLTILHVDPEQLQ